MLLMTPRLILLIVFCALLVGCRAIGLGSPDGGERTAGRLAAAEKLMSHILRGLEDMDYAEFSKDFTAEMRESFPEKGFAAFVTDNYRKKYGGVCESRELLGELNVGELTVLLWKARYKNYKNDVLLRLDVGEADGGVKVFRFLVQ